jgi:hypothetical protein
MRNNVIRVGDHLPERRTAEAFAIRKTEWSVAEYLALADRLADAVTKLQIATANENFSGVVSAYHDFHDIAHQTAELNKGLMHAIEAAKREYTR